MDSGVSRGGSRQLGVRNLSAFFLTSCVGVFRLLAPVLTPADSGLTARPDASLTGVLTGPRRCVLGAVAAPAFFFRGCSGTASRLPFEEPRPLHCVVTSAHEYGTPSHYSHTPWNSHYKKPQLAATRLAATRLRLRLRLRLRRGEALECRLIRHRCQHLARRRRPWPRPAHGRTGPPVHLARTLPTLLTRSSNDRCHGTVTARVRVDRSCHGTSTPSKTRRRQPTHAHAAQP